MGELYSVHTGLNHVDPTHYGGWDGSLAGCVNDALAMAHLAAKANAAGSMLFLDSDALAKHVLAQLRSYCSLASPGDTVLFTNSSHGGQLPDENGDESDRADETVVMFDREVVDDELAAVWSVAQAGVRILVISDSCHSGTVIRAVGTPGMISRKSRMMPHDVARSVYLINKDVYDPILQDPALREYKGQIKASVLSLSGCQDNQLSYDGDVNGLFTEKLLQVLATKKAKTYGDLVARVRRLMPSDQSPDFRYAGPRCPAFEASVPFTF